MDAMRRRQLLAVGGAAVASVALPLPAPAAEEPPPPLTLVVPAAAGGGTDATARVLARLLAERLGEQVVVVGRPQRSGTAGLEAIAGAAPDGHTFGILTTALGLLRRRGLSEHDHRSFTPLGMYNADPAAIHVRADSPMTSIGALLDALAGGEVTVASGGPDLGLWHLALAGLLRAAGLPSTAARWQSHAAAPSALASLLRGDVSLLVCSLPEAQALGGPGSVRTLAVLAEERLDSRPDVPTLAEVTGLAWTATAWRGVVGPKGLVPEITAPLVAALQLVQADEAFRQAMTSRGYRPQWAGPESFAVIMANSEATLGPLLEALDRAG
jgi:tripartite-type tricarboxylate transporter receptor subunit TctC